MFILIYISAFVPSSNIELNFEHCFNIDTKHEDINFRMLCNDLTEKNV